MSPTIRDMFPVYANDDPVTHEIGERLELPMYPFNILYTLSDLNESVIYMWDEEDQDWYITDVAQNVESLRCMVNEGYIAVCLNPDNQRIADYERRIYVDCFLGE